MPRWFGPVVAGVVGILVLCGVALIVISGQRGTPEPTNGPTVIQDGFDPEKLTVPDPALEDLIFPEFTLVDSSGQPVTESYLDGSVTVVDFIFTNCPFVCPTMVVSMSEMADRLADTPVQFLSITVDPENDTPEVLAEYAEKNGATTKPWKFLTGEKDDIYKLVHDGIGFAVAIDDSTEIDKKGGGKMFNIQHPSSLVLVGPDRQVLSMHLHDKDVELDRLEARARALVEKSLGTP